MAKSPLRHTVAIAGLGVLGSSTALHLARRGAQVIGFDLDAPPHAMGSSHGRSRIIRQAYFEHPDYVPLVQRSLRLWNELQTEAGRQLIAPGGALMLGRPDSALIAGAADSAGRHGLRHEWLEGPELARRFPMFSPEPGMVGLWDPDAAALFPESCVSVQLGLAEAAGAQLHLNEPVMEWTTGPQGVRVTTARGCYQADQLVLAVGSYLPGLLEGIDHSLWVERQVQYWFKPVAPSPLPIHLWELADGTFMYGFPDFGDGLKVALHHGGEATHPENVRRTHDPTELAAMGGLMERHLPGVAGQLMHSEVCLYTNTPDGHFWIDRHPSHPDVFIASACSGHGFKFASGLGEALAAWILGGEPATSLALFRHRSTLGLGSV